MPAKCFVLLQQSSFCCGCGQGMLGAPLHRCKSSSSLRAEIPAAAGSLQMLIQASLKLVSATGAPAASWHPATVIDKEPDLQSLPTFAMCGLGWILASREHCSNYEMVWSDSACTYCDMIHRPTLAMCTCIFFFQLCQSFPGYALSDCAACACRLHAVPIVLMKMAQVTSALGAAGRRQCAAALLALVFPVNHEPLVCRPANVHHADSQLPPLG